MNICWENSDSLLLMNPRYSIDEQNRFQRILENASNFPAHIWLSTSGSSSPKWVGLSKQALLISAEAVNRHLESGSQDCWIHVLPDFHVGGLSIWARAYLSGAKVCDFKQSHAGKWQPGEFYRFLQETKGTLTALVPTQLHDLLVLGYRAPSSLRAVIIGGGALLPSLYEKALTLDWPVLPSYGLTECASQVATACLDSWKETSIPSLHMLSHVQGCEKEGRLCIRGTSLLSCYAYLKEMEVQFIDPKVNGWLVTEDRGYIQNGKLKILGRADAMIKVGGESVDLARLETHLQTLRLQLNIKAEVALVAMPDTRLGHRIHLTSSSAHIQELNFLIQQFQQTVLPFERIRKVSLVPQLPRSSLGKIHQQELMNLVYSVGGVDLN